MLAFLCSGFFRFQTKQSAQPNEPQAVSTQRLDSSGELASFQGLDSAKGDSSQEHQRVSPVSSEPFAWTEVEKPLETEVEFQKAKEGAVGVIF